LLNENKVILKALCKTGGIRCSWFNNSVNSTDGPAYGGALYIEADTMMQRTTVTLLSCRFVGNTIESGRSASGGAIHLAKPSVSQYDAQLVIENCQFVSNRAVVRGTYASSVSGNCCERLLPLYLARLT
jgi:hypothetical protein